MKDTSMGPKLSFMSACGSTGRLVAGRILAGSDLLATIEGICLKHGIENGQITASIGSLKQVAFNYVSRLSPEPGKGYTTHMTMKGPFSLLAGQGLVSRSDNPGRMNIHFHAVISGEEDRVYGGHIMPGTIALSNIDIFLQEIKGIEIAREQDPSTGITFTCYKEV